MSSIITGLLWAAFLGGLVLLALNVRGGDEPLGELPVGTPLVTSLILVAGAGFSLTARRKRSRRERLAERRQKAGANREEHALSREERQERISLLGSSRRLELAAFGVPLLAMVAVSVAYVPSRDVTGAKVFGGWMVICLVAPTLVMIAIHEPLMVLWRRLGGLLRPSGR